MTKFTQSVIFKAVLNAVRDNRAGGYDDNQGADFHLYLTYEQMGELVKKCETLTKQGY